MAAIANSFRVRVPVLSVQMTWTAPSDSTASSVLTSTCFFAMRRLAIDSASVIVGNSPSGTLATMIPNMKTILIHRERPLAIPMAKKRSPMTTAIRVSTRTMRLVSRCSGDSGLRTSRDRAAILPSSVRWPVAKTTAVPLPRSTLQPAKAMFGLSISRPLAAPVFSGWERDSPVSGALLTSRSSVSTRRASAAMRSPSASSRTSPGTRSSASTSRSAPSRQTRTRCGRNRRSASIARSARISCAKAKSPFSTATPNSAQPSSPMPMPGSIASATKQTIAAR